jgi:subtilisin family serine protease
MQVRSLVSPQSVRRPPLDLGPHVPGEVIVRLKTGTALREEDMKILEGAGAMEVERLDFPATETSGPQAPILRIKLNERTSVAEAIAELLRDPAVLYAVPNNTYELQGRPTVTNDPVSPNDLHTRLWGLHNPGGGTSVADADIDAPEAWAIGTGSRNGPLVAILDTGADYNHPDLNANIWTNPGEVAGDGIDNDSNGVIDDVRGYNAFANNGNPMDGHSHGTHVAGTIGAVGNNGIGVVGVNWEARMMPVKIFSDAGSTTTDAIIRGINYATRMGARVTSNSWGGGPANQAIKDAFGTSPAMHLIASGNNGRNNDLTPTYPAGYDLDNIISVGSSTKAERMSSFSNYGATSVDLVAPGSDIYSTTPNGRYGSMSGTSMATPHVSGAVALLLSEEPDLTNAQVRSRLLAAVDTFAAYQGKTVTGGRLNVAKLLQNATDLVERGD